MIKVKYVEGNFFVYDVHDWSILRKTHRIIGQIIGNTSFIPSLPVKLLPEEVLLLLDQNLASIEENSAISLCSKIESAKDLEATLLKVQREEYTKIRKVQLESVIDIILEKRKKLGDTRSKNEIFNEELSKSIMVTKENMVWPILLKSENKSNIVSVPQEKVFQLTSPLKATIFKDLWERGYYVTSGEKFNGDFLVYFGDPLLYHAIFIIKCVESEQTFSPLDLIAFGRLGVAVKKKAVLGSLREGAVNYMTINWIDA